MIMLKKWMRYMLLAACCLTLTGCARKETGSELLTETKDAVVPVDSKVDPVAEETPEGTAFIFTTEMRMQRISCRRLSMWTR